MFSAGMMTSILRFGICSVLHLLAQKQTLLTTDAVNNNSQNEHDQQQGNVNFATADLRKCSSVWVLLGRSSSGRIQSRFD